MIYTREDNGVTFLYRGVLRKLLGLNATVVPRGMPTRELMGASLRIYNTTKCVVGIPTRRLNYQFMIAEWFWIATGMNSVEMIGSYCDTISKFSDNGINFAGAYGPPWAHQLRYVLETLRADKDSRQAVITIWQPSPAPSKDIPCTVAMQYFVRDGQLNTIVTMRSSDAWLGLPYDMFNFARLGAIVAGELGLPQGWLQLNLGSLHLYERNVMEAEAVVKSSAIDDQVYDEPALPGVIPAEFIMVEKTLREGRGMLFDLPDPWMPYATALASRFDKTRNPSLVKGHWRELIYATK